MLHVTYDSKTNVNKFWLHLQSPMAVKMSHCPNRVLRGMRMQSLASSIDFISIVFWTANCVCDWQFLKLCTWPFQQLLSSCIRYIVQQIACVVFQNWWIVYWIWPVSAVSFCILVINRVHDVVYSCNICLLIASVKGKLFWSEPWLFSECYFIGFFLNFCYRYAA